MAETTWTPARLRALRRRLGLSQRRAAAALGVAWMTWFHWEKGAKKPSPLAALALTGLEAKNPQEIAAKRP